MRKPKRSTSGNSAWMKGTTSYNPLKLILRILFYLEVAALVILIQSALLSRFSWVGPTVATAIAIVTWLIFGAKKGLENFSKDVHKWVQRKVLGSYITLLMTNALLLIVIGLTFGENRRFNAEKETIEDHQIYLAGLASLGAPDPITSNKAAQEVSRIFLKHENRETDYLPGVVTMCEIGKETCRSLLENPRLRRRDTALNFQALIHDRIRELRNAYCGVSAGSPVPGRFVDLGHQTLQLGRAFQSVGRSFTDAGDMLAQTASAEPIVYNSLDILAMLMSRREPGTTFTLDELLARTTVINEIKQLMRSEPFKERYVFVTKPGRDLDAFAQRSLLRNVKECVDEREVMRVLEGVLSDPWTMVDRYENWPVSVYTHPRPN